jgi:hypothetical protein
VFAPNVPVSRKTLDATLGEFGCHEPDCATPVAHDTPMFLAPACHPTEATYVSYVRALGTVVVSCAQCMAPVATIQVAP